VSHFEGIIEAIKPLTHCGAICRDDRKRVAVRTEGQPFDVLGHGRHPTGFAPARGKYESLDMAGRIIMGEECHSVAAR
jgi:hypothetical protein